MMESFFNPTNVKFGPGSIAHLKNILNQQSADNILIITDEGVRAAGVVDKVLNQIKNTNYDIYDGCKPNPTVSNCEEALNLFKKESRDLIIAVGGGSSIDVGKAVSILVNNGGSITDYEGADKFIEPTIPMIAIPTTAGTASEVTSFTVVTEEDREYKLTVAGSEVAPDWAVLDPELTLSLPAHITAATGLDALVHAIESYTNKMSNTITKTLAREAIRKISCSLRQAVYNGDDLHARTNMLMGSLLAGLAFNNTRLGNCHAMSHPVSAMYGVPHGVANAVIIPHVMEFNSYAAPERFSDIAADMGEDIEGRTLMERAELAVKAVRDLASDIGLPENFKKYDIKDSDVEKMAADAMLSGNIEVNIRLTDKKDIIELFNKII